MVPETAPENRLDTHTLARLSTTQPDPTISDKRDQVLAAIELSRVSMEEQLGTLTTDISLILDDHRKLADKVKVGEKTIADRQPAVTAQQKTLQNVLSRLATVEERKDDLEGRSRRCNIRVLGLPEGVEGTNPLAYMETWVKSFTPTTDHTAFFSIERAHRVPARKPLPGAPPRPMLAKFLHSQDRDAVLRAARNTGPLQVENKQIMIFPDYARAVQKQRSSFLEVIRRLRANNIQYSLLFPARLKSFMLAPLTSSPMLKKHASGQITTARKAPQKKKRETGDKKRHVTDGAAHT